MHVVPLQEIAERGVATFGPKAAVLAKLRRAGLPVPDGFCIAANAYVEHVSGGGLAELIRGMCSDAGADRTPRLLSALAEISRAIVERPVSPALRAEIEGRWCVLGARAAAVRSSAIAEDLPGRSFAGQYDSFLGVLEAAACVERVKDCWASLWSERAFDYRCRNRIDHVHAAMAVIVQALVPADAAGVMFTADPVSGRRDCAVIEGSFGLGPAIVAGKVTPDRLVVSTRVFRVERRTTSAKSLEVVPDGRGGVQERVIGGTHGAEPCLDDALACRLALLGAEIESLLGERQDIEWAVAGGTPHVLQARPITALPPAPARSWEDRQIWTNANLREAVPDVMTPMTWSGVRMLAGPLLEPVFARVGLQVDAFQLAGLVAGRVYFNVNTLVAIGTVLHLRSRMDAGAVFGDGGQGVHAPAVMRFPEEDLPHLRFRLHRLLLGLPGLAVRFLRNPSRLGRRVLARFGARIDEEARAPWRTFGDVELARHILAADRVLREEVLPGGRVPLIAAAGMTSVLGLTALCRRWLGDEDSRIAHRLLVGLGGMEDAEAGLALWRLAALARADVRVHAAVVRETTFAGVEQRLAGTQEARPFLAAWSEFMATHGHHGPGEFEIANPRWVDQPDVVLRMVRGYLSGFDRADPILKARQLAEGRACLEVECLREIRNPLRRAFFGAVLRRAQEGLRFRETMKSQAIRYFALVRAKVLELGARLAARGVLAVANDIFFLEMEELERVAAGSVDPRPLVAARRREHDRNAALAPPAIVFGRFESGQSAPEVIDERAGVLRGIGVSPGMAEGNARVIMHPDRDHVLPGEVLVAPCTDPSWAPCFLHAAAIVIDQGGLLSHGSIVAREYGIPCVVNVGPASRILRTGQRLAVDGDRGTVAITGGEGEPPRLT